jgi:hypothetical protein
MKDLNKVFGNIRSIAHSMTGERRWEAIIQTIDMLPEDYLHEVMIPYLDGVLRDDPSERRIPYRWFLHEGHIRIYPACLLGKSLNSFRKIIQFPKMTVESPHMRNLTRFSLMYNNLGDDGAIALAESASMSNLTHLNLCHNTIGDEGAKAIANSAHMKHLTSLVLSMNPIGDEGAKALAQSPYMKHLTHLHLGHNLIGDEGAKHLANSPYMSNLTYLRLQTMFIGDERAKALAHSAYLKEQIKREWIRS